MKQSQGGTLSIYRHQKGNSLEFVSIAVSLRSILYHITILLVGREGVVRISLASMGTRIGVEKMMRRSEIRRSTKQMKRSRMKRSKLNPRSKKMSKFYQEIRVPYVRKVVGDGTNPCPVKSPVCTGYVQGVHEKWTRARAGSIIIAHNSKGNNLLGTCHLCNTFISEHKEWSEARGLLLKGEPSDN